MQLVAGCWLAALECSRDSSDPGGGLHKACGTEQSAGEQAGCRLPQQMLGSTRCGLVSTGRPAPPARAELAHCDAVQCHCGRRAEVAASSGLHACSSGAPSVLSGQPAQRLWHRLQRRRVGRLRAATTSVREHQV